jgi:hypothetical protein
VAADKGQEFIRIGTADSEYGHLKEVSARRIIHRKKAILPRFAAPNSVQMAVSLFLLAHEILITAIDSLFGIPSSIHHCLPRRRKDFMRTNYPNA